MPFTRCLPGRRPARRRESRELVFRLAGYVNSHDIGLVLLAGDLFDSTSVFRETGEQLSQALGAMRAEVCVSPGNHDFYAPGSPWETVRWPENVHIFRESAMQPVEFPQWNVVVHGAAFTAPEQSESLLAGFCAPADGKLHLGLLHGEIEPAEARYDPIAREEIADSGLAYLALGHIHKRAEPAHWGKTLCAWPGCPEGRGFDELGEKGVYQGCVFPDGTVSVSFVPLAGRRYESLTVDVTGKDPRAAVEAGCRRIPPGISTGSCSPARPERAAWTRRRFRRRWRIGFMPWRSGTAPAWPRMCGGGRRRTRSGGFSCGSCGKS